MFDVYLQACVCQFVTIAILNRNPGTNNDECTAEDDLTERITFFMGYGFYSLVSGFGLNESDSYAKSQPAD
jgi:hypothetical protein